MELGEHREALDQLERVLADESAPENIAELSRSLRERIGREAAMLTIAIEGEAEGAEVVLDDEPLEPAWLAREVPVAPGAHTVAAVRDGRIVAEAEVTAVAGEAARVRLLVAAGAPPPPIADGPPAPTPLHEDWRLWLGVGAGVAVLVAVIAIVAVVAQPAPADAVPGNFMPQVITW